MRTIKISINPKKHSAFYGYFHMNAADSKRMYNSANFYIRNTMTGIRKSPEERTHLETEALHDVFTGIQKANAESLERYNKKMVEYRTDGGMKNAVCAWKLAKKPEQQFPYPTYHSWFLSYETLDAIFKYTNNPVYKCAWTICRFAMRNHADIIVLGQNKGQKQEVRLGTRTNQNFVSVPFCRFQGILRAVASKCGIYLLVREESYTSKASFLDMDDIPTYQEGNNPTYVFSGKRIQRGLYRSKDGDVINADINGACNIIRKEYPGAFNGKDITFLHQTTGVIKYQDLYGNACSVCSCRYNRKSHKAGISSRTNHLYKKHRRMELLAAFR